jgi:hypothetical protein
MQAAPDGTRRAGVRASGTPGSCAKDGRSIGPGRGARPRSIHGRHPPLACRFEALQVRLPRPRAVIAYLALARAWPRAAASHGKSSARNSARTCCGRIGLA